MKKKKVLILHGQPGMGHLKAAKAIEEVFLSKYPEIEIKNIDGFDLCSKFFRYGYPFLYDHIVSKFPAVFEICYNGSKTNLFYKILDKTVLFFTKKSKFVSFITDFAPDFIVATNPLPLQIVSLLEEEKIISIPSANVCTDFVFHPLWYSPDINYYFVANKEMQDEFISYKIDPVKIKLSGIPVRLKFSNPPARKETFIKLGLDPLRPILLIVGGYLVWREVVNIINTIEEKNPKIQFVVISGRDKKLYKGLEKSGLKRDPSVKVLSFVNNMEDYMTVADLILSKPGGSTVAECLAIGLPMVSNKIIPGQEEGNLEYLIANGAGAKAIGGAEKISETIVNLFSHPEKLEEMKNNCRKIGRPNAATDIVDFVVSKI